jgi:nickel-dependent lactate racemase
MRVGIDYGLERFEVEVPDQRLIGVHRQPPAPVLADRAEAVRAALERPLGFPSLRRALTPDDHVAVVVDEELPHLAELLTPLLEHVTETGIDPEAITLVCAPPATAQGWVDDLPDAFQEVRLEVHDPGDRRKLSYLATTNRGRRIYMNRTAVDADQLVVLARRSYDPMLGYTGPEGAIFPALCDEATRQEMLSRLTMTAPGEKIGPALREAVEVAWLLGAPFMLQVIEGAADDIVHVVGGVAESGDEGRRLLNARWRVTVDQPADTVVAAVSGLPSRHTFADLARAAAAASRVVKSGGRIVLVTRAAPALGPGAEQLRQAEDAGRGLDLVLHSKPADLAAAFLWARAAQQAGICLLSGLPVEVAEELFATPLDNVRQVQRLAADGATCLFLADAHKTLAVVNSE